MLPVIDNTLNCNAILFEINQLLKALRCFHSDILLHGYSDVSYKMPTIAECDEQIAIDLRKISRIKPNGTELENRLYEYLIARMIRYLTVIQRNMSWLSETIEKPDSHEAVEDFTTIVKNLSKFNTDYKLCANRTKYVAILNNNTDRKKKLLRALNVEPQLQFPRFETAALFSDLEELLTLLNENKNITTVLSLKQELAKQVVKYSQLEQHNNKNNEISDHHSSVNNSISSKLWFGGKKNISQEKHWLTPIAESYTKLLQEGENLQDDGLRKVKVELLAFGEALLAYNNASGNCGYNTGVTLRNAVSTLQQQLMTLKGGKKQFQQFSLQELYDVFVPESELPFATLAKDPFTDSRGILEKANFTKALHEKLSSGEDFSSNFPDKKDKLTVFLNRVNFRLQDLECSYKGLEDHHAGEGQRDLIWHLREQGLWSQYEKNLLTTKRDIVAAWMDIPYYEGTSTTWVSWRKFKSNLEATLGKELARVKPKLFSNLVSEASKPGVKADQLDGYNKLQQQALEKKELLKQEAQKQPDTNWKPAFLNRFRR